MKQEFVGEREIVRATIKEAIKLFDLSLKSFSLSTGEYR